MTDKSASRRLCRSIRDGISAVERLELDRRMTAALLNCELYSNARSILTYVSVGSEPDTRDFINAALRDGKTVAVPNCDSGEMLFYQIDSLDSLSPGNSVFRPSRLTERSRLRTLTAHYASCPHSALTDRATGSATAAVIMTDSLPPMRLRLLLSAVNAAFMTTCRQIPMISEFTLRLQNADLYTFHKEAYQNE